MLKKFKSLRKKKHNKEKINGYILTIPLIINFFI